MFLIVMIQSITYFRTIYFHYILDLNTTLEWIKTYSSIYFYFQMMSYQLCSLGWQNAIFSLLHNKSKDVAIKSQRHMSINTINTAYRILYMSDSYILQQSRLNCRFISDRGNISSTSTWTSFWTYVHMLFERGAIWGDFITMWAGETFCFTVLGNNMFLQILFAIWFCFCCRCMIAYFALPSFLGFNHQAYNG